MPADSSGTSHARPRLLDRIDRVPPRRERWRQRLRRGLLIGGATLGALLLLALIILVRAYFESRWTLPETHITARVEEDLQYNITYDPDDADRLRNINFTTDEIIHEGNPAGGIEGVLARVERNQTENRHTYELKNDRDLKIATATELRVTKRPLIDKTEVTSTIETGVLIQPDGTRLPAYCTYAVSGKRLHEHTLTTTLGRRSDARIVNTMSTFAEWYGWFGDFARSGSALAEYRSDTPADLAGRLGRQHDEWHGHHGAENRNPFPGTLKQLRPYSRPLFRSDEGLPGPWWQMDRLPQGSNLHLFATADGSRSETIRISWDKTGIFPWRWLNGGYRARDRVGELFRVQIRDFWFHFQNELAYLYFLDLNGDGRIDKDTELIGQVYYKSADSPLKESFTRKRDVALTQENTQEFTRNKTYVFRVGADPARAERDFLLCDGIEKLLPDAISKGFGRDSHLGYIERARDDYILARTPSRTHLHSATTMHDPLDWKRRVVELLRAAGRDYAEELAAYHAAGEAAEEEAAAAAAGSTSETAGEAAPGPATEAAGETAAAVAGEAAAAAPGDTAAQTPPAPANPAP